MLDCIVGLYLIFGGISILFSVVAVPIYISTNSAQGFPFLYILANPCQPFDLLLIAYLKEWEKIFADHVSDKGLISKMYKEPYSFTASLMAQTAKNPPVCRRPSFSSWVGKFPWRRDRLSIPVFLSFPGGSDSKESACNAADLGSIPGLGRSPGGRHGNPLQYSCLENPMDRGAWWATIHEVAKSQTQLSTHTPPVSTPRAKGAPACESGHLPAAH